MATLGGILQTVSELQESIAMVMLNTGVIRNQPKKGWHCHNTLNMGIQSCLHSSKPSKAVRCNAQKVKTLGPKSHSVSLSMYKVADAEKMFLIP